MHRKREPDKKRWGGVVWCGVESPRLKKRRLSSLIGWIFVAGRKNHEVSVSKEKKKKKERQTMAVCFGLK